MQWKNTNTRWGLPSMLIHWLMALTVFSLFALGWWMTGLDYYHTWYKQGPDLHRSIGVLIAMLLLLRLAWRYYAGTPKSDLKHSIIERRLAHAVHILLYALLFIIVISGYLISTADGRAVSVFDLFDIPALSFSIEQQEDLAGIVHWYVACSLMLFVGLHAAGALKHHFIDKDTTLKRMLPSLKQKAN